AEARDVVGIPGFGSMVPNDGSFTSTHFGNISGIFKAVLWEDPRTGNLVSGGLTLSLPTASSRLIDPGPSTLAYVQPFVGYIFNYGNAFLQGFSSVTAPLAHAESIVLFNDIGVGYFVYRDPTCRSCLRSVAPTFEVHITNPLRQSDVLA